MNKKPNKKSSLRRRARNVAMQALYQWQFTHTDAPELIHEFLTKEDTPKVDQAYFSSLVAGTIKHIDDIDALLDQQLDRKLSELNPVECAVLRVAVYELQHHLEVPYRVVINEALEVTKIYGSEDGHKYINAVLDALAPKLRAMEMNAKPE